MIRRFSIMRSIYFGHLGIDKQLPNVGSLKWPSTCRPPLFGQVPPNPTLRFGVSVYGKPEPNSFFTQSPENPLIGYNATANKRKAVNISSLLPLK